MRARDENKEAAIREKAIELIVNEGFSGFSMGKLAKAANVSPATLYIYYKNKEDLLNSLYNNVHATFIEMALQDFDPNSSLEKGLMQQWKNRLRHIEEHPYHFRFTEQFKNSPLINHKDVNTEEFKEIMKQFVTGTIKRGELQPMEPELFWALAFGPFYSLTRFHIAGKSMMNDTYSITEQKLKTLIQIVVKALKP
jgi:TetR/AcrR family transcriptional repressor of multidrug resistance operon